MLNGSIVQWYNPHEKKHFNVVNAIIIRSFDLSSSFSSSAYGSSTFGCVYCHRRSHAEKLLYTYTYKRMFKLQPEAPTTNILLHFKQILRKFQTSALEQVSLNTLSTISNFQIAIERQTNNLYLFDILELQEHVCVCVCCLCLHKKSTKLKSILCQSNRKVYMLSL